MVASQLKSARMAAHLAKHVKAARSFSSTTAFRREIQDAYILSAARTPTAKVSILP
jgi:acetyl-CoA C-acetyltransferase